MISIWPWEKRSASANDLVVKKKHDLLGGYLRVVDIFIVRQDSEKKDLMDFAEE